jgi:hypothetical protein
LLSLHTRSPTLTLLSCLALFCFALIVGGSFAHFLTSAMVHVKSTARPIDAAMGTGSEGHGSGDSVERMESAPLSNVGSYSEAGGDVDEGSRMQSYVFGPSTVTVSHI